MQGSVYKGLDSCVVQLHTGGRDSALWLVRMDNFCRYLK